ncbi:MAG: heat-inducible transcription repressor HrcA [Ruminococcus sp.]|nr:heat-inducible transcription repressor HrcA [Ruminococcus sp.]
MEIALRKQKILAAVIENYIQSGEPIGSKALMNGEGLNVSSATIRNELADLTFKGFLVQPHTSAGRIPTELGYRYYVDNLMDAGEPDERVKRYIENRLESYCDAPERILKTAGKTLSELLGTAAVATTPPGEDARVHRIKFVQTGRYTSMLVLITSSGMVKSRLFRCDFAITPEMLNVFDRSLNEALAGRYLSSVNQPFAQTFAASFGELGLLMPDMLTAVMDACVEASGMNIYTEGTTRLLYQSDLNLVSARNVLEFLGDNSKCENLFKNVPDGTNIYIGRENTSPLLRHSSLISTRYTIENQPAGALALVGSIRTDYKKTVSILEFTAKTVSELISELVRKG